MGNGPGVVRRATPLHRCNVAEAREVCQCTSRATRCSAPAIWHKKPSLCAASLTPTSHSKFTKSPDRRRSTDAVVPEILWEHKNWPDTFGKAVEGLFGTPCDRFELLVGLRTLICAQGCRPGTPKKYVFVRNGRIARQHIWMSTHLSLPVYQHVCAFRFPSCLHSQFCLCSPCANVSECDGYDSSLQAQETIHLEKLCTW